MKSVREALTGWWAIFGILVTATTVFNLFDNTLHLNVDQWLALVLAGYQKVFHFPFRVCEYFLPIKLPVWLKDALVLWSIGAAATLRANRKTYNSEDFKARFSLWRSIASQEWRRKATYRNLRISIVLGFYHPVWQFVLVFFTWPRIRRRPRATMSTPANAPSRRANATVINCCSTCASCLRRNSEPRCWWRVCWRCGWAWITSGPRHHRKPMVAGLASRSRCSRNRTGRRIHSLRSGPPPDHKPSGKRSANASRIHRAISCCRCRGMRASVDATLMAATGWPCLLRTAIPTAITPCVA